MATAHEITPLSPLQLMALASPRIRQDRIFKKPGSDMSYLKSYDIRANLNKIFGFGQWSGITTSAEIVQIERDVPKSGGGTTNFRVTALARFRLTIHQTGAVYEEAAAASQQGSQIGEVTDFAIKTAESDAFKRCAANLGTQFGLSLYNNGALEDVVQRGLAPGQEWNVPDPLLKQAQTWQALTEAGVIPLEGALVNNPEGQALVQRGLRAKAARDEVPMALDTSLDGEPADV